MKVIDKWLVSWHGEIGMVVKGNHGTYLTVYNVWRDEGYCTCIGWQVYKKCKHLKYLKEDVGRRWNELAISIGETKSVFREFPSSLEALNEMFSGAPYSSGEVFAYYAPPNVGKSLLMIQEAVYLTSKGYNVLYIETEGSGEKMIRKWAPVFAQKFEGSDLRRLYFESRRTLETLARYFGFELRFVTKEVSEDKLIQELLFEEDNDKSQDDKKSKKKSTKKRKKTNKEKGGKIEVIYRPLSVSLLEEDISKYKIDFVILDSLSNPIRLAFPTGQQHNPEKSFVEGRILQKLIEVQEKYRVGSVVILHASFNPANPYETKIGFRGGLAVAHNVKRVVYIASKGDFRKFWLVRAEDAKPWSRYAVTKITDLGYIDVPKSKWEELLTPSEKKRLKTVD